MLNPNTNFYENVSANINVRIYYTNLTSYNLIYNGNISNILFTSYPYDLTFSNRTINGTLFLIISWTSLENSSMTYTEYAKMKILSVNSSGNVKEVVSISKPYYSINLQYPFQLYQVLPQLLSHQGGIYFLYYSPNGTLFLEFRSMGSTNVMTETINGTKISVTNFYAHNEIYGVQQGKFVYNITINNYTSASVTSFINGKLYLDLVKESYLTIGSSLPISFTFSKYVNTLMNDTIVIAEVVNGTIHAINSTTYYN